MSFVSALLRTCGFTCLYVLATYAGRLTVMDETSLSLVWPAAGVSAVWFLAQRASRWYWLDAVALGAATWVVNVATGATPQLTVFFVAANLVQVFVFTALFRRWLPHLWGGGGDKPLATLRELWRLISAAFLCTLCGALIGPTAVWLLDGEYSWPATAVWLTRNTVSILLIGAAGLRLGQLLHWSRSRPPGALWARLRSGWAGTSLLHRAEYLAVVATSIAAYVLAFGVDHGLPLAFPLLVMTVWAALRLHTVFVILHDFVFGSLAVLYTLHGVGPFAQIESHAVRALIAQLFVGMVAVVGLALALGRDERTALVDELRTAQHSTAEQAGLMKTIVDSMNEGLTVVDAQGRFLLRNPAIRELLGGVVSSTDAMAAPGYYGLYRADGTPLTAEEMPYRRALAGEVVRGMDVYVRNEGLRAERVLSVSSTAIDGVAGTRYAVTVFHDVTAERRQRDELAAFAGVVAHDLLNPLATVEGWTETLAEVFADDQDHPAAAEAADGVVRIRRAATRMRNLINDLLGYTTARDATIAPADVDLGELARDIAMARIDQAQSGGTPVPEFDVGDLHAVRADPVLVRQLLDNLVSNAIKYTGPGVTPRIVITSAAAGDMVSVAVTDNGIGIPAGQHDSIFDNFHRAHSSAGYTGTGLGLGICKRIVERHDGTISAADNPTGRGSRFTFTLPAAGAAVRGAAASPPAAASRSGAVAPVVAADRPDPSTPARISTAALPGAGFAYTARLVLDYLHEQLPLAFWSVTRVEHGRQVYLYLDADNGYGLREGGSHPWEDSFCVRMTACRGPFIATEAQQVPVYAEAGINRTLTIGTYVGAPITEPDGAVFGSICGLDPEARPGDPRLTAAEPLLVLLGNLLTVALANDRAQQHLRAESHHPQAAAQDPWRHSLHTPTP